jgi:peptidyl-prolyl cis-trans isomerase C
MTKLRVLASAAGLVGILLPGCSEAPVDPVLFDIGDRMVTRSQFEDYIQESMLEQAPFARAELKVELLEQFIEEQLLLRAAEEEGIKVAPEELAMLTARADFLERQDLGESGVEEPANTKSSRELEAHLQVRKLIDEKVLQEVGVDDEEVADYFEEHRAYYKRPQAADISQILVEAEEEANQILEQLLAGTARFEDLAGERSVGPEAAQAGRLGTFRRGELPASFENEVFALKKGSLSAVVKTDFGYHIFRLNEVHPARDLTLDEVRDAIRVELLREKSDAAMAIYLEALKERYPVRIYTEELDFPYSRASTERSGEG